MRALSPSRVCVEEMSRMRMSSGEGGFLARALRGDAAASGNGVDELQRDLEPGELVSLNGLSVVVGPPGTWTKGGAHLRDGGYNSITALTGQDGSVFVVADPEMAPVDAV